MKEEERRGGDEEGSLEGWKKNGRRSEQSEGLGERIARRRVAMHTARELSTPHDLPSTSRRWRRVEQQQPVASSALSIDRPSLPKYSGRSKLLAATTSTMNQSATPTPSLLSPQYLPSPATPAYSFVSSPAVDGSECSLGEEDRSIERRLSFIVKEKLHEYVRDLRRRTAQIREEIIREPTPEPTPPKTSIKAEASEVQPTTSAAAGGPSLAAGPTTTAPSAPQGLLMVPSGAMFGMGGVGGRKGKKSGGEMEKSLLSLIGIHHQLHALPTPTMLQQQQQQLNKVVVGDVPLPQHRRLLRTLFTGPIDPFSRSYTLWLALVVVAFLYNAFGIPLRCSYPYQTSENLPYWLLVDYTCDAIYLVDAVMVKTRLAFMKQGVTVATPKEMRLHYLHSKRFKLDLLSLIPADIPLYFLVGPISAWRVNRLLKLISFWELFNLLDSSFSNAYVIRIAKTFSYMIYLIHCNSCVYYVLSAWQAFGQIAYSYKDALAGYNITGAYTTISSKNSSSYANGLMKFGPAESKSNGTDLLLINGKEWYLNKWVYNGEGNAYIRCFYFTAAVATSTGNNPAPTNVIEYAYMTFSWMMGVFVFALLLGQIRDIVSNANSNSEEFRTTMDKALSECKRMQLPDHLVEKVRAWFLYTWEMQKTLEEKRLVDKLPLKLQTDLALSVHYTTLSKVQLFQDAERALLRDLVLKLRPVIFLPGDMICSKGDVGKEMYIVNNGVLEVVGGEQNEVVFATLTEGSVFGEISLLAIGGNNRRTANIRSKGYSTLFVLSKEDLNLVLRDYPDAQQLLKRRAREILEKDQKKNVAKQKSEEESKRDLREKCRVSSELKTPRMLEAVAQLLPRHSSTSLQLSEAINASHQAKRKKEETLERKETGDENEGGGEEDCKEAGIRLKCRHEEMLDDEERSKGEGAS